MDVIVKLIKRNMLFIVCLLILMTQITFAEEIHYSDVTEKDWAYNSIMNLTNEGIVQGYGLVNGYYIFKPYEKITRAEFVRIVISKFNPDDIHGFDDTLEKNFDDVLGHWAEKYIASAKRNGLTYGKDEKGTLFYPDDYLTREEAFVIIARACIVYRNLPLPTENEAKQILTKFSDSQFLPSWALRETALCVNNNIVTGVSESDLLEDSLMYLLPTFMINRSEICKIIDSIK